MTKTKEAAIENNPDFSPVKPGGADGGRLQVIGVKIRHLAIEVGRAAQRAPRPARGIHASHWSAPRAHMLHADRTA